VNAAAQTDLVVTN